MNRITRPVSFTMPKRTNASVRKGNGCRLIGSSRVTKPNRMKCACIAARVMKRVRCDGSAAAVRPAGPFRFIPIMARWYGSGKNCAMRKCEHAEATWLDSGTGVWMDQASHGLSALDGARTRKSINTVASGMYCPELQSAKEALGGRHARVRVKITASESLDFRAKHQEKTGGG